MEVVALRVYGALEPTHRFQRHKDAVAEDAAAIDAPAAQMRMDGLLGASVAVLLVGCPHRQRAKQTRDSHAHAVRPEPLEAGEGCRPWDEHGY